MKDGKMVSIAYHLLESSIGAYIEWIVNELMMTANKIKYKDVVAKPPEITRFWSRSSSTRH